MLKKCSNCGDEKSELILDFGSIPITSLLGKKDSFSLQYRKCEKCLVTHVVNSPPPNILYGGDYNFFSSSSTAYISYVSEIIKTIQTNIDLSQSDVLEIGCNDGTLVREIASKAKSVVGIDPFSLATETFDCDINNATIINDYFDSQAIKSYNLSEKFDVVVVNNVITHVDDVFDFLKALSLVVKNNGIIYFEICDYKKVIENDRFDYFYHGVTNLILPNQIEKLLINFECITDYGFESFDPFSRKFILQKTNLNNKEYNFQNYQIGSAQKNLAKWCEGINIFFENLSNYGNVVGYGANSKAGLVFAVSSVAKQKISIILDINLKKKDKSISGSNIQIKHIDNYDLSTIDCIVLFASHIFKEVEYDLKSKGYSGAMLVLEL